MASFGNVGTADFMGENGMSDLGKKGVEFFANRKIKSETADRLGIFTGSRSKDSKVVPSPTGNILVFPFAEHDEIVAEKYRPVDKKTFWQREGGKRIFWNAEAVGLAAQRELIITEGEIDALSALECGFELVVSVPDGAPTEEVDIDTDKEGGKFSYLWEARKELASVASFVIAVDNDAPGTRLAAELVRRLSAARCKFVEYPAGCKDLNDVLVKHGPDEVASVLNAAQLYPLRGLYRLADYPEKPELKISCTGWRRIDEHLKIFPGELMVVTGIPGHGKSSWTMALVANLCRINKWCAAVFSPEMPIIPHLRDKMRCMYLGRPIEGSEIKNVSSASRQDIATADAWIERHFVFLDADPSGGWNDDDCTFEWVMDRAHEAVLRDGIRVLLIDPWNEIEHGSRRDNELMTEYIGRCIRDLRRFAQQREVVVIIVAHPTKEIGKEKRHPGLYDIDGSAHWANKPDHGVSVHLPEPDKAVARIHVTKVRFGNTGKRGVVDLIYDIKSHRYSDMVNDTGWPVSTSVDWE